MTNFEPSQRGKKLFKVLAGGFLIVTLIMKISGILLPNWLIACVKIGGFLAMLVWFFCLVDRQ